MKSLVDLTVSLLEDSGRLCAANPTRDILTVTRRTKDEGDSFLTITLPSFCRGFEKALDDGFLSPALFPSFRRAKGTCLPAFLRGFMERIFGPDGHLLEDVDTVALSSIRQICLFAKKVLLPCTRAREKKAEADFLKCEQDLRSHVDNRELSDNFRIVSRFVVSNLLRGVPFGDPYAELRPRHGPGTTREGVRGNQKFLFATWPSRLDQSFPFSEFGIASIRNPDGEERLKQVTYVLPRDEQPVKVCFVPKTLKSPRVIAIEPVSMQYAQQAISDWLRPRIELRGRYTSGHVNFTDQSINAKLALSSSINRSFATLDMSEASDRVTCRHVWSMLESVPHFRRYVFSCRSTRATLPSGMTIPLRKFASMGSALCFPMESLAFFNAIVAIRLHIAGKRPTPSTVFNYSRRVYVYGDDLIVPTDEAAAIAVGLESLGFLVNKSKSFWNGNFRESCGTDAYNGVNVTPVYLRRMLPRDRADTREIVSAVALANQLYDAGLWGTTRMIRREVERLIGSLPSCRHDSPGLGWTSYSLASSFNGWSQRYQRLRCRMYVPTPIKRRDPLEGDAALLKCFALIGSDTVDPKHLLESVRYGNLALQRRWVLV